MKNKIALAIHLLVILCVRTTAQTPDLIFIPDTGVRIINGAIPTISYSSVTSKYYLVYNNGGDYMSTSTDGLTFTTGTLQTTNFQYDGRNVLLPNGKYRRYLWNQGPKLFQSSVSTDGIHFTSDPGSRYTITPGDSGTMGVYDIFKMSNGKVLLYYLADLYHLNNCRKAVSSDSGYTFVFSKANVFGDSAIAAQNGASNAFVDTRTTALSTPGKRRMFSMKQTIIYSFTSNDEGDNFTADPGIRLSPSDFVSSTYTLNTFFDPSVVLMPDGRYRMFVASLKNSVPVIVSATSCAALPTVVVSGNLTSCAGLPTTLNVTGSNSYLWSTGATTTSLSISSAGTYTVTGYYANGCYKSASVTVTVNPSPTATISGNLTACSGTPTVLTAGGGSTYLWSTGATTASINVSTTGSYTVTATNSGCSNSKSATVAVNPSPTISITGNNTVCTGGNVTLTAGGGSTYTWTSNGTLSSNNGTTVAATNITSTANITVTGTDTKGCAGTSTKTITVVTCGTGIIESALDNSLIIYPNPSNGNIAVTFIIDKVTDVVIKVTDIKGQQVYAENKKQCNGEYKTTIDLSKFSKGVYFLNIVTDKGAASRQLVVE